MPKTSEQDIIDGTAGGIFDGLLNKRYIKPFPINGNYPGIDGLLQLINEDKTYTSKYLHYQLKGKASLKKHTFPCKVSDLEHWAKSSTPVIFILVDNDKKAAFWRKIDRRYVRSLGIKDGQKYRTITIDPRQEVNKDSGYLNDWYAIAIGDDNFVADEWTKIVAGIEEKLNIFVGLLYLIAPIRDGDTVSIERIKNRLSIEGKEFTVLLYEALKRNLVKSVGRILIVSDEKAGLTGLVEYVSSLSKRDLKALLSLAKDEKQRAVILKRMAEIRDKNSEKVLTDIADELLKDIKKSL